METEHRYNVTLREKAKNEDDYRERIDINIRTVNQLKNEVDDLRVFIEDK
jgi:DNA-binding Xre family transcriptional regulator